MTEYIKAIERYREEKALEALSLPWWRFFKRRKLLKQARSGPSWASFRSVRREG